MLATLQGFALQVGPALTASAVELGWGPVKTQHDVPDECADVLFVGVRGSGQSATDDDGMGRMVIDVREGVKQSLVPGLRVRQLALAYPAYPVEHRDGSPSLEDDMWDKLDPTVDSQDKWLSGVDLGVQELLEIIDDSRARCAERIILAGYSQGALVIHRALAQRGDLPEIVAAVLIADPARGVDESEDPSALSIGVPVGESGVLTTADWLVPDAPIDMSATTRAKIAETCLPNDSVCDPKVISPVDWVSKYKIPNEIHGSYGTPEGAPADQRTLQSMGQWAAERLNRSASNWAGDEIIASHTNALPRGEGLQYFEDATVGVDGTFYYIDDNWDDFRIFKIRPGESREKISIGLPDYWEGWPTSVAVDWAGNLYITHFTDKLIRKLSPDGTVLMTIDASSTVSWPELNGGFGDVAVDHDGNIYGITARGGVKYRSDGTFVGQTPAMPVWGEVKSAFGPNNDLYVLVGLDLFLLSQGQWKLIHTMSGPADWFYGSELSVGPDGSAFVTVGGSKVYRVRPDGREELVVTTERGYLHAGAIGNSRLVVGLIKESDQSTVVTTHTFGKRAAFSSAPTPAVAGVASFGATLTAKIGLWSPTPHVLKYQWYRNDVAIAGASKKTYTLVASDIGSSIKVNVQAERSGFSSSSKTSRPTSVVTYAAAPSPTIAGNPVRGELLTAKTGAWTPTPDRLTYQWFRDDQPVATTRTYRLTQADVGKTISLTVSAYLGTYAFSPATASTKTAILEPLTITPQPTIAGTPIIGGTLTAKTGIWQPSPVSLTYQWRRSGVAITGATAKTYNPGAADVGKTISVVVTGGKAGYFPVSKTSVETTAVK